MGSDSEQALLREMARDMDVALYRRYGEAEAAKILGVHEKELARLREQGRIAYLAVSDQAVGFFGYQLLTYLLDVVVPVGAAPEQPPTAQAEKPVVSSAAELISVEDTLALLGIGRTKLYEMLAANELESVKIGRRKLIKRASLRRFTDVQAG